MCCKSAKKMDQKSNSSIVSRWELLHTHKQPYVPGLSKEQAKHVFAALTKTEALYLLTSTPPKRVLDQRSQSDPAMQFVLTLFVQVRAADVDEHTVFMHIREKAIAWQRLGDTLTTQKDRPSFDTIDALLRATYAQPIRGVTLAEVRKLEFGTTHRVAPVVHAPKWIQGVPTFPSEQFDRQPFRVTQFALLRSDDPSLAHAPPFMDRTFDFILKIVNGRAAVVRYDPQVDGWMCWLNNGDLGTWFAYPSLLALIGRAPDIAWLGVKPTLANFKDDSKLLEVNGVQVRVTRATAGQQVQLHSVDDAQVLKELSLPAFPWSRTYASIKEATEQYFYAEQLPSIAGWKIDTTDEMKAIQATPWKELELMDVQERQLVYGFHDKTLVAWARLPVATRDAPDTIVRYETFPLAVLNKPSSPLALQRLDLADAPVWIFAWTSNLHELKAAFLSSVYARRVLVE